MSMYRLGYRGRPPRRPIKRRDVYQYDPQFGQHVAEDYRNAKRVDPSITKGEWWYRLHPGVYSSPDSARRGYEKIVAGESSGKVIQRRLQNVGPLEQNRPRFTGGQGYWKVNVRFTVIDENGDTQIVYRSFVGSTNYYTRTTQREELATRMIESGMIADMVDYWQTTAVEEGSDSIPGEIVGEQEIEVFPIENIFTVNARDFDVDFGIDEEEIPFYLPEDDEEF